MFPLLTVNLLQYVGVEKYEKNDITNEKKDEDKRIIKVDLYLQDQILKFSHDEYFYSMN